MKKSSIVLFIIAVIYVLSPVDLFPGPVDDILISFILVCLPLFTNLLGNKVRDVMRSAGVSEGLIQHMSASATQQLQEALYAARGKKKTVNDSSEVHEDTAGSVVSEDDILAKTGEHSTDFGAKSISCFDKKKD